LVTLILRLKEQAQSPIVIFADIETLTLKKV